MRKGTRLIGYVTGSVCIAVGVIGLFLPLLPGIVFLVAGWLILRKLLTNRNQRESRIPEPKKIFG
jgi:uncharacterized membrane protein YbaN (DUF454 family)